MANSIEYVQLAAQKQALLRGATPDQKRAIKYFIPDTGCAGLFGGVKDEEYDAIVNSLRNSCNSYQRAIDKIGLDEDELKEIPPVYLYGYEDSPFSKTTLAGAYRTNLYSVSHLFFSSTQVYLYQLVFNTMKNERSERTEEYFYKDITNFSTSTDMVESFRSGGCLGTPAKVSVEVQRFSLVVHGDKFTCATYGNIDPQVKAMKNKLREKKL